MCLDPLVFCMLILYWDSVPNHNRLIIASNASVHTHSLFYLWGTMPQTLLNTEFILRLRVLRTLLKGTPKHRPPFHGCNESLYPDYLKGYREAA